MNESVGCCVLALNAYKLIRASTILHSAILFSERSCLYNALSAKIQLNTFLIANAHHK